MTQKNFVFATLLCLIVSTAFAAPGLSVVPGGIQSGNWVWDIDITPDFALAPGGTPLDVELGFRLTSAPLLSATNINPSQWDAPVPGNVIFGWETLGPFPPGFPAGLQVNTGTGEIFVAYGSIDFPTSGPKPFLKIVALGPANGGPLSSTIQWLGAYIGKGRISQIVGNTAENFDIFSGSNTQVVPEPTGGTLLTLGAIIAALYSASRESRP